MPLDARAKLVHQLRGAYSGELAAGYAYRGHWKSIREGDDRTRIQQIEAEEWHHRELVGGMLRALGGKPSPIREVIFWCIGRSIGAFCHIGGWFAPMYGAGRLERGNIVEYEEAAVYASQGGHEELVDCILMMAEVEWEHEFFFRSKVLDHPMLRMFKMWPAPPPREMIRGNFARARPERLQPQAETTERGEAATKPRMEARTSQAPPPALKIGFGVEGSEGTRGLYVQG